MKKKTLTKYIEVIQEHIVAGICPTCYGNPPLEKYCPTCCFARLEGGKIVSMKDMVEGKLP